MEVPALTADEHQAAIGIVSHNKVADVFQAAAAALAPRQPFVAPREDKARIRLRCLAAAFLTLSVSRTKAAAPDKLPLPV